MPGPKKKPRLPVRERAALRRRRVARGMSQEMLARMLIVPYATLRAWEDGRRAVPPDVLDRWRAILFGQKTKHPIFETEDHDE